MEPTVTTSPIPARSQAPDLHFLLNDADIPAESLFLQWLTRLPLSADVAEAARRALRALDRVEEPSPETRRLRVFLSQATAPVPALARRRTRARH